MDYQINNMWLDVHNHQALMQMRVYESGKQIAVMNYNVINDGMESRSFITNLDFVEDFMPDVCRLMFNNLAEEVGPDFDFVADKLSAQDKQVIETVAYPAVDIHAEDILESVSSIRASFNGYPKELEHFTDDELTKLEERLNTLDKFEKDFAKLSTVYSFRVIPTNPRLAKIYLNSSRESFEHLSSLRAKNQICILDTIKSENGTNLTYFSKDNIDKIHKSLSAPYKMLTDKIAKYEKKKAKAIQR